MLRAMWVCGCKAGLCGRVRGWSPRHSHCCHVKWYPIWSHSLTTTSSIKSLVPKLISASSSGILLCYYFWAVRICRQETVVNLLLEANSYFRTHIQGAISSFFPIPGPPWDGRFVRIAPLTPGHHSPIKVFFSCFLTSDLLIWRIGLALVAVDLMSYQNMYIMAFGEIRQ